jgi:hypothetical protein
MNTIRLPARFKVIQYFPIGFHETQDTSRLAEKLFACQEKTQHHIVRYFVMICKKLSLPIFNSIPCAISTNLNS